MFEPEKYSKVTKMKLSGHHYAATVNWSDDTQPIVHKPWRLWSRAGIYPAIPIQIVVRSSNLSDTAP